MLDAVLRQAGYRTGLFTSPFLHRFNERMRVNGEEIPDNELEDICDSVRPFAEAMEERPSEFELITAIAMLWFLRKKCEIVVLEVGLGGEYDSTNVIDPPECAVITAIGLDHTAMLGNTIPEIASAKAGILKPGSPAVTGTGNAEADEVIHRTAREKHALLYPVDYGKLRILHMNENGTTFDYNGLEKLTIPLIGAFQPRNAAIAIETLLVLRNRGYDISDEAIRRGLATVSWAGRFEILSKCPLFILDGAHNPHGISAVAESLKTCFPERRFVFLMAVMRDKSVNEMIRILVPLADRFITVRPNYDRALTEEELATMIRIAGGVAETAPTVEEGVSRAVLLAGNTGGVCALGSLYISASIREALKHL